MTKLKWDKEPVRSTMNSNYWTNPKLGFDKAWHEQRNNLRQHLGIHKEHDWEIIKEQIGPHAGKVVCNTCKNKKGNSLFVTWLPKDYII